MSIKLSSYGGGASGWSGYSGTGTSGYSGTGGPGQSGYSGTGGTSGQSGYSGTGQSGYSGTGQSGYSGTGQSGYSGTGQSGYSGTGGTSGQSGYSGTIGVSGYSGLAGGLQTIWIPAISMYPRTTNGPSVGLTESATNKVMIRSYDFDQTTQEFVQFSIRFPKSWNAGTVTFQPYWTAASGAGTAIWTLAGVALGDNEVIDTAFGTSQSSTDTLQTANYVHAGPVSSAITIASTPTSADWVAFQLARDPANDTLNADALLLGICLFITINAGDDA